MGLFAELRKADAEQARCYLLGALRDGTFKRLHNTVRISQADIRWLRALRVIPSHPQCPVESRDRFLPSFGAGRPCGVHRW